MATTKKIYRADVKKSISKIEETVDRALTELELVKDLAGDLKDLQFVSAREVECPGGKTAVVIFVPFKQHKKFQKIQSRLIRELEKKLSGKHICILAQRTIMSKNFKRSSPNELRPRSRTLTSVHASILDDIVYPVQIVGKRTRMRLDGSKCLKIYLDPKDVKEVDYKLKTFGSVYTKLTNSQVDFLFPSSEL